MLTTSGVVALAAVSASGWVFAVFVLMWCTFSASARAERRMTPFPVHHSRRVFHVKRVDDHPGMAPVVQHPPRPQVAPAPPPPASGGKTLAK